MYVYMVYTSQSAYDMVIYFYNSAVYVSHSICMYSIVCICVYSAYYCIYTTLSNISAVAAKAAAIVLRYMTTDRSPLSNARYSKIAGRDELVSLSFFNFILLSLIT